ncbi:hypothetical protein BROUX41_003807 [Berkeleyomyces rouxiae]|uniref:uncharacterized protein n=1 Tax=Berkeleyomyces rouxiae TaxID=2035830 RepID=UPI003B7787F0
MDSSSFLSGSGSGSSASSGSDSRPRSIKTATIAVTAPDVSAPDDTDAAGDVPGSPASHASRPSQSSVGSNTTSIAADGLDVDPIYEMDDDSAFMNESEMNRASLTSSMLNYRQVHGRTYQNFTETSEYWGPNDEQQNEGLNLTHNMFHVLMDGKLFNAPIGDNPENVIDVGTGTGVWAIDFADQFPQANVIGTDLSPIQPTWVPPNLRFELDDAQKPWAYPDNYFDFVHLRVLLGSIRDWPKLYKEIFRCLKPGGYFEHYDFSYVPKSDDGSITPSSGWSEYSAALLEAGETMGQTFRVVDDSRNVNWFEETGFEDITEIRYKVPVGGWPTNSKYKMIGYINYVVNDTDLDGYGAYFLTRIGWSQERINAVVDKCRAELYDHTVHVYFDGSTVYGRKPLDAGATVHSSSSSTIGPNGP